MPRVEGAQRSVRIRRRTPIRGSRWGGVIPCKDDVLGSIPRCSTKFIPVKRTGCVHPTVNRTAAGSNPATGANCRVRLLARIPASQPGEMGSIPIRGSSFLPVAQPDERRVTNGRMQVRLPGKANHQGVGEPSRPRLSWKQETVGSNPTTLTNRCPLAQWQSCRF